MHLFIGTILAFHALMSFAVGQIPQLLELEIENTSTENYLISWDTQDNVHYQLEMSPDLSNWIDFLDVQIGDGLLGMVVVETDAEKLFFRNRRKAIRRGLFDSNLINRNDDGGAINIDIGFQIDIFGEIWDEVMINNNGNITIERRLTRFTPTPLQTQDRIVIAPFWADVDTRSATTGPQGEPVRYGQATVNGNNAFGVNWIDVGYFDKRYDKLNSFQVVLINRPDTGSVTNFDVEFNYDRIAWETGDDSGGNNGLGGNAARAGISNGSNSTIELAGAALSGSYLDTNPDNGLKNYNGLIHGSRNSEIPGRHVFQFRGGQIASALVVDAGPDLQRPSETQRIQLQGSAFDPLGGAVTTEWSVIAQLNTGEILFDDVTDPMTIMTQPPVVRAVVQLKATSVQDPSRTSSDVFLIGPPFD